MYKTKKPERNFIRDGVGILTTPDGIEFMVDIDDFHKLKNHLWCNDGNGYAVRSPAKNKKVRLYKFILPDAEMVDHKNLNRRDNRKENLRIVNSSVNNRNRDFTSWNKTSGTTGVGRWGNKWAAKLMINRKLIRIGAYDTIEEAKRAWIQYVEQNGLKEYYHQSALCGGASSADAINTGTKLTQVGEWYRDAVKSS